MLEVEVLSTPELGDRSYVAHDGTTAIVVDPQRDLDRFEELLKRRRLRCAVVAETHVHNDYITGGFELARRTGAEYLLAGDDKVAFFHRGVSDGDRVEVATMHLEVLATPGHTYSHLAYLVSGGGRRAAFTGGSLLFGSVGRTDLLGPAHAAELARLQHRSARRLVEALPDETELFPTHGFGSFCSAGPPATDDQATLAGERARNAVFLVEDEDAFVERLLSGYGAFPAYYARMAPENLAGPAGADLSPVAPLDAAELRRRAELGEWVIDLRAGAAFAHLHLAGTLNFPLGSLLTTYLGWLLPDGARLTVVGERREDVAAAQRQLTRIGIDSFDAVVGPIDTLVDGAVTRSYRAIDFAGLDEEGDLSLVDVRLDDEWRAGHIEGATHLALHELAAHPDRLPEGRLALHCASGYRAGVAASIVDRLGRDVVLVDDDWSRADATGRRLVADIGDGS